VSVKIQRVHRGDEIRRRVSGGYQHATAQSTGYWIQIGNEVSFISDGSLEAARKLRSQPKHVEIEDASE